MTPVEYLIAAVLVAVSLPLMVFTVRTIEKGRKAERKAWRLDVQAAGALSVASAGGELAVAPDPARKLA